MSVPGFSAKVSLGAKSLAKTPQTWSGPGGGPQIIPALPIGGYACLGLAAACRDGSKRACQALKVCNRAGGEGGGECHVAGGGVTCCYAGDCTTFW
jgi:hypothetical protein